MRAIVLKEFGPPDVLTPADVAEPVPGPGQALIEVELANITFVETQVRAGRAPNPALAPRLPVIPGNGVGGVVRATGEGVDRGLVGTRVVSSTGGSGGYAEWVCVPAEGVIPVPDELGLAEAVALLADGRTAIGLVRRAAVAAGETVLVEAAAGGVGSLLVQLACRRGARVVAAARGARKLELARGLGAAFAVDYGELGWSDRVGGVDVVFDGVGGDIAGAAFRLLRRGGRMVAFGAAGGTFAPVTAEDAEGRGVTVLRGLPVPPAQMLELTRAALREAAAGRLRPVIGQTYPLERAAAAHAAIEARAALGKTLLAAGRAR